MTTLKSVVCLTVLLAAINFAWAGTQTTLYDFKGGNDGAYPDDYGSLARDSSGNLYGTTEAGGACDQGTVFRLARNGVGGWTESVLYAFCGGPEGSSPFGGVILDESGNIYGTTAGSMSGTCGAVFELTGATLIILHSFTCGFDGAGPITAPIRDDSGNLYGTTPNGGSTGWGVVYEITRSGDFKVLYNFCQLSECDDGGQPLGGLAMDSTGNLYGTTVNGGDPNCVFNSPGCGLVFKLSKVGSTWSETVLHKFSGKSTDGANPMYASLTLVTQKTNNTKALLIYGVTSAGGQDSDGTVFRIVQQGNSSIFKVLHSYSCCFAGGTAPVGTLTIVGGRLFGTTSIGGTGDAGIVFELSEKNKVWTESVLYNFVNGEDGGHPYSGVVFDPRGVLYGVARSDGGSFGTVYQVTP